MELLAVFAGVIIGCLIGVLPGFHTNLIAVLVAGLQADAWLSSVFLVAVGLSRSVVDAVPTVFLGFSGDVMALLPAHKLLKKGCGVDAVKFSVMGAVLGLIAGVLLVPVFIFLFPFLFSLLKPFLFWVLLAFVLFLLVSDSWLAWLLFWLAGLLGLLALNSVVEPLFPLLSGLFGAGSLLLSMKSSFIPPQFGGDLVPVRSRSILSGVSSGVLAGSFVTLFPGMSPSQAAALVESKKIKPAQYLVLTGALGTVDVLVSLVTFVVLGKARNGAVAVIEQLIGALSFQNLFFLVCVACFSVGVGACFALFVSNWFSQLVELVDYRIISGLVILFLAVMSVVLSGWLGGFIFVVASAVGLIAPLSGIRRSHAMGCLLLPTLLLLW